MNLLEELIDNSEGIKEKRNRIQRSHKDFGFFCKTYLYDYFFTDPAEYQQVLYDVADNQAVSKDTAKKIKTFINEKYKNLVKPTEQLAGAMFIEPREHGKTVRWSFAYALWCALTSKRKYILLIGASADAAKENLINIKRELEENEDLFNDFGELQGQVWRDDRIELTNGTCLQAKGAGASMRGTRYKQYRPDLIILDDVLKDDAVESPSQRDKIYRWLKRVVFNLGKTAFIIWVNTVFHSDDPISRLMHEVEENTLKRWIAVRLSCYKPDGNPLWPEYWSKEALEEKREQLGFEVFSTEYGNEPLSDEERIIKPHWIESYWYVLSERPPLENLRIFCGVDPATGKHDGSAIEVIGVDKQGVIWDLEHWNKVCSETVLCNQLILFRKKYKFELIAWEEVAFSGIYGNYIMKLAAEKNVYLPIKKLTTRGLSKEARIRSISPLLENGIVRIRKEGSKELRDQLTQFPKGAFDDLCDALELAVRVIPSSGTAPVIFSTGRIIRTTAQSIINRARSL